MGFDEGQLVLNSPSDTFYPGQVLSGRLEFDQDKVKKFRGIRVEVKGFCKVHWTSTRTRRQNDRDITETVTHESYEEYMNVTMYLVGGASGEHHLNPGHHVFPFECHIPETAPSTFEGSWGHVRYHIKAVVDRAFKTDQTKKIGFRVHAPMDLNTNPYCKEPIEMDFEHSYCCWCVSVGSSQTLVKVPKGGWSPGELIPIEVAVTNTSNVELEFKFQIWKNLTFHAHHEPDTKHASDMMLQLKKGPVPGGTTRNWTLDMQIPDMDAPNLDKCRFIDLKYAFKVLIESSGCHDDDSEERPLFIGTIPVATNIQPPLLAPHTTPGVTTYPQGPVVTQPYPTGSPYPIGSPYPNPPGAYPPNNQPYPTYNGSSYPPAGPNPPYPTPNLPPYPPNPGNSPYPSGRVSPYPPSPNMATNQYQNTPPGPNPAFSTSSPNMPYPVNNAPYPSGINHSVLKTGNIGFVGHSDGAAMPLLPHGGAPYPSSPYASASAPAVTTPDQDGNKPLVESHQKSPNTDDNPPSYNPDFK